MKALCVSDKVVDILYSTYVVEKAKDVNVIFGCGDLPYYYLDYIMSMLNVPLFYVHGNHDSETEHTPSGEKLTGPVGGINLDNKIVEIDGLLVAGLQGSIRYKPEGTFQHTEKEMWLKVFKLVPQLIYNKKTKGRAIDVVIAHSPPLNIHNGQDHIHRGFTSFLWLMKVFKPKYLFHGHHHVYQRTEQTVTEYHQTIVNNVYPYKIVTMKI